MVVFKVIFFLSFSFAKKTRLWKCNLSLTLKCTWFRHRADSAFSDRMPRFICALNPHPHLSSYHGHRIGPQKSRVFSITTPEFPPISATIPSPGPSLPLTQGHARGRAETLTQWRDSAVFTFSLCAPEIFRGPPLKLKNEKD